MTLAQLLPQAKFVIVTTPQPAAQSVARRGAEMAAKFDLELLGVIENMSGFTTPDGERFTIFGEGGGQLLADELDVPLLGKVPLSEALREHADSGIPLVTAEPDSPASQAIRQAAAASSPPLPRAALYCRRYPAQPNRRRSAALRCRLSSQAERATPELGSPQLVSLSLSYAALLSFSAPSSPRRVSVMFHLSNLIGHVETTSCPGWARRRAFASASRWTGAGSSRQVRNVLRLPPKRR